MFIPRFKPHDQSKVHYLRKTNKNLLMHESSIHKMSKDVNFFTKKVERESKFIFIK